MINLIVPESHIVVWKNKTYYGGDNLNIKKTDFDLIMSLFSYEKDSKTKDIIDVENNKEIKTDVKKRKGSK